MRPMIFMLKEYSCSLRSCSAISRRRSFSLFANGITSRSRTLLDIFFRSNQQFLLQVTNTMLLKLIRILSCMLPMV